MASASGDSSDVPSNPNHNMAGISDNTTIPITNHKLNGHNNLQWSQSVMMFLCGKGKDVLLSGASKCAAKDDKGFKVWKSENNMVMSWLITSMNIDIGENFFLYPMAKEIWDAAMDTYSCKEVLLNFEIESTLQELKQGDASVTQYSTHSPLLATT